MRAMSMDKKISARRITVWQAYKRNKLAVIGLSAVVFIVLITLLGPSIYPYSPYDVKAGPRLSPPSANNPMGTDDLGRDVFSQFMYGARTSLFVGVTAAALLTALGILVGSVSGYIGGWVDDLLMRMTDWILVLPSFVLAVVLMAVFGSNMWFVAITIGIAYFPGATRLLRAEFLRVKEEEFVEAAKALGLGPIGIMFKEILPNAIAPLVVNASMRMASAILLEAGLSFIGLGDPNLPSWGKMISNSQSFLRQAWWMGFFPGLGIFLTVLGFNLIGDGLNEVLNPRSTQM